jgi:hypothetical protein
MQLMKVSPKQPMGNTVLLIASKVHHNRALHGLVLLMLLPSEGRSHDVTPV